MIFRKYIRESINDMDKRCELCNTLLNEIGTCPVCDDGEEDYGEELAEDIFGGNKKMSPHNSISWTLAERVLAECERQFPLMKFTNIRFDNEDKCYNFKGNLDFNFNGPKEKAWRTKEFKVIANQNDYNLEQFGNKIKDRLSLYYPDLKVKVEQGFSEKDFSVAVYSSNTNTCITAGRMGFTNHYEDEVSMNLYVNVCIDSCIDLEEYSKTHLESFSTGLSNIEKLKAAYPELNFDTMRESMESEEVIEEGLESNISFKGQDEQKEFFDLCKEIGIKTAADLKRFVDENVTDGEEVLKALHQYRDELGDDFEIQHESFEGGLSNLQKLKAAYPELDFGSDLIQEDIDDSDYDDEDDKFADYDDDYDLDDDVELDRRHAALYGGDRMYCNCGRKLVMDEWGGRCPYCDSEDFDDDEYFS